MDYNYVDEMLNKYIKKYKNKQELLKDELETFVGKYTNINEYANKGDLSRFKRYLEQNGDIVKDNGYVDYMVHKNKSKSRITYKEILEVMILVAYAKFQASIYKDQFETLNLIGSNVYSASIKECEKLGKKPIRKYPLLDDLLISILLMPNEKGLTYQEQNDADTIYNARQIYEQVIIDLIQGIEPDIRDDRYSVIFDRQQRREINKKKDQTQKDKFSGYIDNQSTFVLNQIKIEMYKIYGFKYCKFVGIEDDVQTLMCSSLSGQIFNLTDLNEYTRYSSVDKRDIEYKTMGMIVGANLPPITNHYHHCRSYIMPFEIERSKNEL